MNVLENRLEKFKDAQLDRFVEKSPKHPSNDVCNSLTEWTPENGFSVEYFRNELDYHYRKWKATAETESNGRESGALVDLANIAFLLYFALRDAGLSKDDLHDRHLADQLPKNFYSDPMKRRD